ncbi:hypothetical protein K488DRAFT_75269, partial [Vararia minispora EC-137]
MPKAPDGWTKSQNRDVDAILHGEFSDHVRKVDPAFGGYHTVREWVSNRADNIINDESIFDLVSEDRKKPLKDAIVTKFRNYYNNNLKKKAAVSTLAATGRQSQLDPDFRRLLLPTGTARQAFEHSIKDDIVDIVRTTGANYQTVLKEKWDALSEEERRGWDQPSGTVTKHNVQRNFETFNANVGTLLSQVCESGSLGKAQMMLTSSTRAGDSDEVIVRTCFVRFTDDGVSFAGDEEGSVVHDELMRAWSVYANKTTPRSSSSESTTHPSAKVTIPLNEDGIPIFPDVDMQNVDIRGTISAYLSAVWECSRPGEALDNSIWERIQADLSSFFDTSRFSIDLENPAIATKASLFRMMAYFSEIGTESPFVFYRSNPDACKTRASIVLDRPLPSSPVSNAVLTTPRALSPTPISRPASDPLSLAGTLPVDLSHADDPEVPRIDDVMSSPDATPAACDQDQALQLDAGRIGAVSDASDELSTPVDLSTIADISPTPSVAFEASVPRTRIQRRSARSALAIRSPGGSMVPRNQRLIQRSSPVAAPAGRKRVASSLDHVSQEPPLRRRRTTRQANASLSGTGKNQKPCDKNVLICQGPKGVYKFKNNRTFKGTCYEYNGQELSAE